MNSNNYNRRRETRRALLELCTCAMLVGLYVVVNRFLTISVGTGIKIGVSFIAPMLAAMLYGPLRGALVYGIGDLLSAMLFPQGPFHPGFTICAIVMGFVWGMCMHENPLPGVYNKPLCNNKKWGVLLFAAVAAVVNCLIIGLLVNSIWMADLYGSKTYTGWVAARLVEELVMTPVNIVLAVALYPVSRLLNKQGFGK